MRQHEQRRAIHSLANDGFSDHEIARLCEMHVQQVRAWLSEREARS